MGQLSSQLQPVKVMAHPDQLALTWAKMGLNIKGVPEEGARHLHRVGEAVNTCQMAISTDRGIVATFRLRDSSL